MDLRGFVDGFVDGYFANFEEQGRRNFTMPAKNPDCSKKFGFRCPPQSVAPCGALLLSEGTLKTNCMQHVYVNLGTPENNYYGRIQKSNELPILAARRARLAVLFYRYEGITESSELPIFTHIYY